MDKSRLIIGTMFISLSFVLALLATYLFGYFFNHDRYWNGTVHRVNVNQAALVYSIASDTDIKKQLLPIDTEQLDQIFDPINGLLLVEVSLNDKVLWSNASPRYTRGEVLRLLDLNEEYRLSLSSYLPPKWNYLFIRWITQPARWFEMSFNPITMPFLWFWSLFFLCFCMGGLLMKSNYLESDALRILKRIEEKTTV
ncbi:hypothetical protein [Endozoicomonas euniceicola]|uniref:Two-component sensor histidine kinase n=1 Tax=Endozoicomonas euniceicola TaxID=1234143 RepID=A0ABY6GU96_9GAMM|nr:hypothetical protein [Endozoicomonas euniceicola]UYM16347.1 hypothetical protein NX720_26735 [Endozoicomonas euniceicola]